MSFALVPAIDILQARTNQLGAGRDSQVLEEVRIRWCTFLETQMPSVKHDVWTAIFNTIFADGTPGWFR